MRPSLARQAVISTPCSAEGVDCFQLPRHTGASRDDIAGVAGEALPVGVCSPADWVHRDADAPCVFDSLEHTLLAITLLVECLAEVVLLSTHAPVSNEGEAVEAAGTLTGVLGMMGSAGRIAGNAYSHVEVAVVTLQALCIAVVSQTMRLPKPSPVYLPASSFIGPPDVAELALLTGLGLIVEHLAERVDGLTDIIVVEVVPLLALQAGLLVSTRTALQQICLWVELAGGVSSEGVSAVAGKTDSIGGVVGLAVAHALHTHSILQPVSQHAAGTGALLSEDRAETVGGNSGREGDDCAEGSHAEQASNDDSH